MTEQCNISHAGYHTMTIMAAAASVIGLKVIDRRRCETADDLRKFLLKHLRVGNIVSLLPMGDGDG